MPGQRSFEEINKKLVQAFLNPRTLVPTKSVATQTSKQDLNVSESDRFVGAPRKYYPNNANSGNGTIQVNDGLQRQMGNKVEQKPSILYHSVATQSSSIDNDIQSPISPRCKQSQASFIYDDSMMQTVSHGIFRPSSKLGRSRNEIMQSTSSGHKTPHNSSGHDNIMNSRQSRPQRSRSALACDIMMQSTASGKKANLSGLSNLMNSRPCRLERSRSPLARDIMMQSTSHRDHVHPTSSMSSNQVQPNVGVRKPLPQHFYRNKTFNFYETTDGVEWRDANAPDPEENMFKNGPPIYKEGCSRSQSSTRPSFSVSFKYNGDPSYENPSDLAQAYADIQRNLFNLIVLQSPIEMASTELLADKVVEPIVIDDNCDTTEACTEDAEACFDNNDKPCSLGTQTTDLLKKGAMDLLPLLTESERDSLSQFILALEKKFPEQGSNAVQTISDTGVRLIEAATAMFNNNMSISKDDMESILNVIQQTDRSHGLPKEKKPQNSRDK